MIRIGGGVDRTQLEDEVREIGRRLAFIVDELIGVRLALDPSVDRPREGIPGRRFAHRERLGHLQRQLWRESRQPLPLLLEALRPLL
jgi:hypothetical protein